MSTADEQVQCPHCGVTNRNRDLLATVVVKQTCRCRSCRGVVKYDEQFEQQNAAAILQEDVSAIDAWLDAVAQAAGLEVQPVRDQESMGEFVWSVQGLPFPWRCEAVYQRSRPQVVVVRLRAEVSAPEALPNVKALEAPCVLRGVHPDGMTGAAPWWGAGQALLTAWLRPSLFRSVVDRLDEVLREVASRSPLG
jgi:transcription elongation factor Elf1